MHPGANMGHSWCMLCTCHAVVLRRRSEKAQRHAPPPPPKPATAPPTAILREATRVERLTYTRTQAAAALGIRRSTFNRRVLPLIETLEMPWGARLIPVDELQRLIAERRRPARAQGQSRASPGRPGTVAPNILERIQAGHAAGTSLGRIARELNAEQVQTAHGGARWWPSTVRAILHRVRA